MPRIREPRRLHAAPNLARGGEPDHVGLNLDENRPQRGEVSVTEDLDQADDVAERLRPGAFGEATTERFPRKAAGAGRRLFPSPFMRAYRPTALSRARSRSTGP